MSDTTREVAECIAELVEGSSLLKARRSVKFLIGWHCKNYTCYRVIRTSAFLVCPQI